MRPTTTTTTLLCGLLLATTTFARGPVDPPIYVEVFVAGERADRKVAGQLTAYDDAGLTLTAAGTPQTLRWEAVTPTSGFTVKSRLIDKASGRDWLTLGRWGWANGLDRQARAALATARKLDPTLAAECDAVVATELGAARRPANAAVADDGEKLRPIEAKPDDPAAGPAQPGRGKGKQVVQKYLPVTAEQHATALKKARERAAEMRGELKAEWAELETDHFVIFTDWDAREHEFLRTQLESAYRFVARQFDVPPTENVFIGKLPVYMLSDQQRFLAFADSDGARGVTSQVLGYFASRGDGQGHMVMWKPDLRVRGAAGVRDAERRWGRTLVHEFTHAFVNRYRTNGRVPRWLNEGIAEYIAHGQFPIPTYYENARVAAQTNRAIAVVFDDEEPPAGGYYYPVMMTLVECLARQDRRAFLRVVDDIKDGVEPEAALKKHFGVDYAGLEQAWRKYARALR